MPIADGTRENSEVLQTSWLSWTSVQARRQENETDWKGGPEVAEFEFQAWPKIPRLNREMIITEKIDGTNAAVIVNDQFEVGAQSRKRVITLEDDNFGFARWVKENEEKLATELGPGYHFGEWWGSGIQRGYGLTNGEKRFSLFNTVRWAEVEFTVPGLGIVPELYRGNFSTITINGALEELDNFGSKAAPGFMKPEGVCIYHVAGNLGFKVTIEGDEAPKGQFAG